MTLKHDVILQEYNLKLDRKDGNAESRLLHLGAHPGIDLVLKHPVLVGEREVHVVFPHVLTS